MNFYTIQLNQFLSKLKGLIKKISKSSAQQIQSHTSTCHQIIVQLIKDNDILTNMNAPKLRLLAYEAVLFLVQMMNSRDQDSKRKAFGKNRIQELLGQIYETLSSIKQLIKNLQTQKNDYYANGNRSKFNQQNNMVKLDRNLSQYQIKLDNILTEYQNKYNAKNQNILTSKQKQIQEEQNNAIIQQMHRIIQNKQKRINQLTKVIKEIQLQKIDLQVSITKIQNQMSLQNIQLFSQIQQLTLKYQNIIEVHKEQKKNILSHEKEKVQSRLKIKQIINQKFITISNQSQNIDSNKKLQGLTQQTISSAKLVQPADLRLRKFSLEKVGSTKSFRRIGLSEDKESVTSQKKYKELNDKNQQLYRLIYLQASTIEELL